MTTTTASAAPTATAGGAERVFRLPDLGEGLTEAEILEWRVTAGDAVAVDQIVVEVETAKAAVDVPVPFAGTVVRLHGAPGTVVEVGQPLLTVATVDTPAGDAPALNAPAARAASADAGTAPPVRDGRTAPGADRSGDAGERRRETYREEERAGSGNVLVGYGTSESGRSRRRAARRAARAAALARAATAGADGGEPALRDGRQGARETAAPAGSDSGTGRSDTGRENAAGRPSSENAGRDAGVAAAPGSAAEGIVHGFGGGTSGSTAGAAESVTEAAPAARLANDAEDGAAGARGTREARRAEAPRVISPVVRRLAREHGLDVAALEPSGPGGVLLRRDVDAAIAAITGATGASAPRGAARTPGPRAEIAGRAAAPETGGDAGTPGPAVRPAIPESAQATPAPTSASAPVAPAVNVAGHVPGSAADGAEGAPARPADEPIRIPLRGLRRAVADKLARSRREIPDATTWVDVDATPLMEFKEELRRACPDAGIGTLALLARICVAGLHRYPQLNAYVDTERAEIVQLPGVGLGFAAQTDRGLVVPVVHDAHRLTLAELAGRLRELTRRAREGTLTPHDLTGGTFTLNDYGVFGVDGSTPIINHPEAGLLGVGRIVDRPWGVDGELRLRKVAQLSLTFDHRVCDGGVAGGFLRFVADCVERPQVLITNL